MPAPKPAPGLWYLLPLLAVVPFVVGPLLAHFHVVAPFKGFVTFAASVVPAVLAVLFGAYLVLTGNSGKGLVCVMVGAIPIATVASGIAGARKYPRINDISTNLESPPALVAAADAPENQGKDLTYPEEFKAAVREGYPDLIALQLDQPAELAFARVKAALAAHPEWRVARVDDPGMTIDLTETAGLFQFTDDVAIRVLPMDQASQIDVRSRSRVGKGDFGANAARIRRILEAIQKH